MFTISDINSDFLGSDPTFPFSFPRLPSLRDLLDPDDFEFQAFHIQQPDPAHQNSGSAMEIGGGINNKLQRKLPPSSKRDRHSKIATAKGLRDRRMRLSLEVARKFFGLQDLLGYEKASKTVEWLLHQANAEIKKLSRSLSVAVVANSAADGEVTNSDVGCSKMTSKSSSSTESMRGKNKVRVVRRSANFGGVASDQRAKARERAKARTIAKIYWSRNSLEVAEESLRPSTSNMIINQDTFVINSMFSCPQTDGIVPQQDRATVDDACAHPVRHITAVLDRL